MLHYKKRNYHEMDNRVHKSVTDVSESIDAVDEVEFRHVFVLFRKKSYLVGSSYWLFWVFSFFDCMPNYF